MGNSSLLRWPVLHPARASPGPSHSSSNHIASHYKGIDVSIYQAERPKNRTRYRESYGAAEGATVPLTARSLPAHLGPLNYIQPASLVSKVSFCLPSLHHHPGGRSTHRCISHPFTGSVRTPLAPSPSPTPTLSIVQSWRFGKDSQAGLAREPGRELARLAWRWARWGCEHTDKEVGATI